MKKLEYAVYCGCGCVRNENEDNFFIDSVTKDIQKRELHRNGTLTGNFHEIGVCDGMGGMDAGEVAAFRTASFYAKDWIERNRKSDITDVSKEDILLLAKECNDAILQYSRKQELQGMGNTLAYGYFLKDRAIFTNIGDSRIYLMREGQLSQISKDHTKAQAYLDYGYYTRLEAELSNDWHVLTQYMGMDADAMEFSPNIVECTYKTGDLFLICSDGLTDMVSDSLIETILRKNKKVKYHVDTLKHEALLLGGRDNITIMLVEVTMD